MTSEYILNHAPIDSDLFYTLLLLSNDVIVIKRVLMLVPEKRCDIYNIIVNELTHYPPYDVVCGIYIYSTLNSSNIVGNLARVFIHHRSLKLLKSLESNRLSDDDVNMCLTTLFDEVVRPDQLLFINVLIANTADVSIYNVMMMLERDYYSILNNTSKLKHLTVSDLIMIADYMGHTRIPLFTELPPWKRVLISFMVLVKKISR